MIRYKKLGYIALNVTDVERSALFYRDVVGLDLVGDVGNQTVFFSCSSDHHNLVLYRSDRPGFKRVAFEVEKDEQLDIAFERLTQAGFKPAEVGDAERVSLKLARAFRVRDPNGIMLEFYSGMFYRPVRFTPHPIKIWQLSHTVLRVPNLKDSLQFYTEILNFKISDYRFRPTGEVIFGFMRCFPNPFHHSFGLALGNELKFFHVAFSVQDIDDLGLGRNRLIDRDVPIVFGPGRHLASGSIFMYFLDPDGLTLEYTLGMEEFPEVAPRSPRMLDNSHKTTDIWEGKGDPRIGKIGHVEVD
ncbi:MAG TPA: VOC family protein [Acidiferrobacterales bacterium]|nr:VOC family protein [Acidiferrobacterales bacterium]